MLRTLTLLALGLLIGRAAYMAMRPSVVNETDKTVTLELSVWGMPFENYLYTDVVYPGRLSARIPTSRSNSRILRITPTASCCRTPVAFRRT